MLGYKEVAREERYSPSFIGLNIRRHINVTALVGVLVGATCFCGWGFGGTTLLHSVKIPCLLDESVIFVCEDLLNGWDI
jgi:hypothetical protein